MSERKKTLEEAAVLFKVLADPNRLRILDTLMQGDTCNCELTEQLGLAANLLSHHLRILRQAGLVNSRRDALDGRWIYYAVDKESVAYWQNWFRCFFDPDRVQERRALCGPEGMLEAVNPTQVNIIEIA